MTEQEVAETQKDSPKHAKRANDGIPDNVAIQKCTEVIPVKVSSEVKNAIPVPRSTWIRELIIRELRK